jgi:opacity protein-like surface antigen
MTAWAETDVAASLFGAFNTGASNSSTVIIQSPANAAGGLLEVRHIKNPLIGYELTYSFNRANQNYSRPTILYLPACPTGFSACGQTTYETVSANAHEVTGDWIASLKVAKLRPFALAGGGVLFDEPSNAVLTTISYFPPTTLSQMTVTKVSGASSTQGVFVYGAGLDWPLLPHIALRVQYRGNLYKAPALAQVFSSTGAFTHTAEPMMGVSFKF